MSSPVEWTRQIENMYDDGATIFVEVGPKRALTMFCGQILEDSNYSALMTNHPKQGGIRSFLCALGQLAILGKNIDFPSLSDEIYTQAFRAGPLEATKIPDIVKSVEVSRPLEVLKSEQSVSTNEVLSQLPIGDWIANLCSEFSGYPSSVCKGNLSLSEDLGMSPTALEKLQIKISKEAVCKIPPDSATTISQLIDCIESIPTMAIKKKILKSNTNFVNNKLNETISDRQLDPYIVSGISLGLPGLDQVFQPDTFERIIAGENFITELSDEFKQRLLDKNLVRIVKDSSGNSELVACESFDMIPQLAGRGGYFDLAEQYGIDSKITSAMDISTKLAFAAGLEALRDAGLPLVADEQVSSNGKRLVRGWKLPVSEQNVTGVIFASVFPGFDELLKHSQNNGADENGTFDRRFLLQILSMGHSQFAQWIGAKGPNTAINNACASTPSAFSIAEDWITTGRATRVIVVSGDDTTSDTLLEWFGAGFTAAGAHSIGNVVEEVSLPFDVRRNGMLLGMGGAAFVIERNSASRERGVTPYCELLGAHIGNSAFHPTRLDVEHVSESFDEFMSKMELNWNIDRHEIAPKTTFMSHEPATPPRGGSAAAEINALRKAFGSSAEKLVITNTKGFTGHPMAVGIEDAVVIYGLTAGKLPPIANFKEPDSELGNLRLSKGGEYDLEYALRHAAGFGSQIALTLFKRIARTTNRIKQKMVINWIEHVTKDKIELRLFERKLVAWRNPDENIIGGIQGEKWELPEFDAELKTDSNIVLEQKIPEPVVKEVPKIVSKKEVITQPPVIDDEITKKVLDTVVEHTGYPADFIEFDQDLEGELGVDSVKQAEIMADLRAHFELPVDESFVLSEYPTLNHMIAYIGGPIDEHQTPSKEEPIENLIVTEVEVEKEIIVNGTFQINPEIRMAVVEVVVEHTGYPEDFIGFDQDLEGELGVDSVKQAEMMGDLRSKFNIPVDETFVLSEHPTLNHIAEYISKMSTDSIISLEEPPVETVEDDISETKSLETEIIVELKEYKDEEIHRWQVEVEEADELNSEEIDVSGRTILITDEDWNLGESIAEELDSRGAKVILLSLDSSAKEFLVEDKKGVPLIRANPTSENQLLEVAAHVTSIGNLGGIIHLAPLDLAGLEWTSKNSSIQSNISTSSLFNLLHELDSDFANVDEGIIVSVSAMDGRHGNRGSHFNPVAAGAHGIVKSYSKERPNLNCTALDIHPELISNTAQLAKHIVTESLSKQNLIEIGLDRDLRRWKLVLFDEALIHETTQLTSDDILLISGGGSGVTAASCVALASSCKDAKSTFVLLGRTELILETEGWINEDEEQIQQRKLELREKLIVENETVNMVQWENAWKPYVRSLDIHITINAIKSTGNEAIYYSCDVTDSKALNKIGKIIGKEFGPITSIIHGAGIEDSKLVGDKDSKVFEQVLSIKTNGWINLIQATSLSGTKNLKLACCFTSIAGRFGNAGQTDYSAANCILDAEMARLNATGNTRAIAIAWTGWREVGMATKGSIEKVFEQAGIQTVGLERGVKLFVDEILHKGKRRVVIAGELGVLDELDVKRDQPLLMPPEITSIIEDQGRICLIDYLLKFEEGKELTIETTFDVETYPFLVDHSIDGVPYLPGVMVLELFAECARLLMPESFVSGFNDVNFGLPVKLTKPEQKIRVIANLEGNNVTCSMESDLINSEGIVFGQPKKHHTAIVRLSKTYESSTKSLVESPQVGDIALSSNFIYSRFFHGPRFQCHGGIIRGISSNDNFGADGIVLQRHQLPNTEQFKLESENVEITLESYPMLIEAAFQNAGMVTMEKSDMQALPIGISSTTILRQPEKTAKLLIRTICRSISDGVSVHDAVIVEDSPKQPKVMLIEGIKLKALAPLDESMRFDLER
jgi:3-oxoacyl-(acyl-carrier-protein) synthase/acyl carrier protein/NAD(P)-dependent dehydrogenase (short-subunit alcohol dehydrogenase family)